MPRYTAHPGPLTQRSQLCGFLGPLGQTCLAPSQKLFHHGRVEQVLGQQHCGVCGLVPLVPRLKGATHVVAHSPAIQELLKRTARFAASDAPVVVRGETGTGKEVIARILHANSERATHPFVAVNVAALPAELLESELFGHGKGAFTGAATARRGLFEAADKGTLFLDEIGEMPQLLQAKLLRVLQDGEVRRVGETESFAVDVRIICATHRDLGNRVSQGLFREDLYYRLKVLTLTVPPLRERREDVLPLAASFLLAQKTPARKLSAGAEARLLAYLWPGNVRELENVVRYAAALATDVEVQVADLPEELLSSATSTSHISSSSSEPLKSLADLESEHIQRVLDACHGSPAEAARVLGIGRNTLWRKLQKLGTGRLPSQP